MKTLFFSLLLSVFTLVGISQTYEVSISGVVTDLNSGDAVTGHPIDLMTDSAVGDFFYYNTVFTDSTGHYEDVISIPVGVDGLLFVSTISCGAYLSEVAEFSQNANVFEFDFQVCGNPGGDNCQAMFYYYPLDSAGLMGLQFIDDSYGNPTSWAWDFGDGNISEQQNPVHTYATEGEYLVSLTIAGDSNCFSTVVLPVWIGNDSIPNDCQAWFFYYPGDVPGSLQFMDESWGNPTTWAWDFGDGNYSVEQNPLHFYNAEGEYLVSLTITDDSGNCTSTYEEMVWFNNDTIWPDDCQAQFFYYPAFDSIPAGDFATQFMDISFGNPISWDWDFGDGNSSSEQNPIHFYAQEGEYEVCLSISNPIDSCESTYCETVFIYNDSIGDCFGWFNYSISNLTVDFEGYLMNSQSGYYTWDFGDGTTGSGASITHTYADDGIYEVLMMVTDSSTGYICTTQYVESIWVGDDITFSIDGNVFLADSLGMADIADVYLMTFDTMGNGLINIATTTIDANGYYEFEEVGFEHCIYFVQAELDAGSAYFGEYVPTYHLDALNWESAWPVFPFPVGMSYDVYLQPSQSIQSGSGLIEGLINEEESRGMMSDVEILLLNVDNSPLTYIRSNENGEFDFPELPYGTYKVYTEIVGIVTSPVTVTLDESNPTANINIVVANGEALLGVGENFSKFIDEVSGVYPNPVTHSSSINIEMKESAKVQLSVLNQYGQLVYSAEKSLTSGLNKVQLNITSFSHGLYILNIEADDRISTVRKFVKLR